MLAEIAPSVAGWPGGEAQRRRRDEGDRHHPDADADPVDDVLADEKPQ